MDEQEIRKWAWEVYNKNYCPVGTDLYKHTKEADKIAAWVMSGTLPEPPAQSATAQQGG